MKTTLRKQMAHTHLTLACLALALLLLTACRSASSTIKVTGNINPEPIVGEIAILHVEAVSEEYSGDGIITIQLPPEINLVEGKLEWHGLVVAGEPFTHEVSICVLQPGQWGISLGAGTTTLDREGGDGDSTRLHITSTADSAQVIPSSEYRGSWTPPPQRTPTSIPEPITIFPECAGDKQTLTQNKSPMTQISGREKAR